MKGLLYLTACQARQRHSQLRPLTLYLKPPNELPWKGLNRSLQATGDFLNAQTAPSPAALPMPARKRAIQPLHTAGQS